MTSPTYDICVGHAFKVDGSGILQAKIAGSPSETSWPYGDTPGNDNPLRVSATGGLWVPPTPAGGVLSKNTNSTPNADMGSSGVRTSATLSLTIKNPSKSYSLMFNVLWSFFWTCYVNKDAHMIGGAQVQQDQALDDNGYTYRDDSGPRDETDAHTWNGQTFFNRVGVIGPGDKTTYKGACRVKTTAGTGGVFQYFSVTAQGFAVACSHVDLSDLQD